MPTTQRHRHKPRDYWGDRVIPRSAKRSLDRLHASFTYPGKRTYQRSNHGAFPETTMEEVLLEVAMNSVSERLRAMGIDETLTTATVVTELMHRLESQESVYQDHGSTWGLTSVLGERPTVGEYVDPRVAERLLLSKGLPLELRWSFAKWFGRRSNVGLIGEHGGPAGAVAVARLAYYTMGLILGTNDDPWGQRPLTLWDPPRLIGIPTESLNRGHDALDHPGRYRPGGVPLELSVDEEGEWGQRVSSPEHKRRPKIKRREPLQAPVRVVRRDGTVGYQGIGKDPMVILGFLQLRAAEAGFALEDLAPPAKRGKPTAEQQRRRAILALIVLEARVSGATQKAIAAAIGRSEAVVSGLIASARIASS